MLKSHTQHGADAASSAVTTIKLARRETKALTVAARNIAAISPEFTAWLLSGLPSLDEAGVQSVSLPKLPTRRWTDGAAADALLASLQFASSIPSNAPNAARFAAHVHEVICFLIHARVRGTAA